MLNKECISSLEILEICKYIPLSLNNFVSADQIGNRLSSFFSELWYDSCPMGKIWFWVIWKQLQLFESIQLVIHLAIQIITKGGSLYRKGTLCCVPMFLSPIDHFSYHHSVQTDNNPDISYLTNDKTYKQTACLSFRSRQYSCLNTNEVF